MKLVMLQALWFIPRGILTREDVSALGNVQVWLRTERNNSCEIKVSKVEAGVNINVSFVYFGK